ncbi:MAG TPA: hypothetical protein VFH51_07845, partial [Myxococcota bacterium]|nr:hypothetical protein [Myxococcota bacterium]
MQTIGSVAMLSALLVCAPFGCASPPSSLDVVPGDFHVTPPPPGEIPTTTVDAPFGGPLNATATPRAPRAPTPRDPNVHAQASTAVADLMLNLSSTDRFGTDLAYTLGVQLM